MIELFKSKEIERRQKMRYKGVSGSTHSQAQLDDYANQNNPNNEAHQDNLDNHADQLNPNNDK